MKYIKHFESFESSKINKTLSFLNKESRTKFLGLIKKLCSTYDLPESKLNDNLFEYLPFNKAIKHNGNISPLVDCPANCTDGKIERKYGKGFRKVTCTTCKGEGKVEPKSELSLIKFWFDQNGNFLSMTGVDGVYRELNLAGNESTVFSKNANDYEEAGERIPKSRMNELLNTGDVVKLTLINRSWRGNEDIQNVIAFVLRHNRKLWAIQDQYSYSHDYIYSSDFNKYGSRAWQMTAGSIRTISRLTPKMTSDNRDPLGYNTQLDDNFKINQIGISSVIKDANFSIVLDLNKLKGIDDKKTEIKSKREENRKGATALVSNEELKQININRYFSEIRKRSELIGSMEDIYNFHKLITRLSGGSKYAGYNLLYSNTGFLIQTPTTISTFILHILKSSNNKLALGELDEYLSSDEFKSYVNKANDAYRYGMDVMLDNRKKLEHNLSEIVNRLKKDYDGEEIVISRFLGIKDLLDKLSVVVYNYITTLKFECLEDVSILLQDMISLKSLIVSNISRDLNIGSWSTYSNYRNICVYEETYNKIIEDLNYCISIVNRKIQLNK